MKDSKFLICLKNPPANILVDSYDNLIKDDEVIKLSCDGMLLVVPLHQDYNIAYIKEISFEDAEVLKQETLERLGKNKIVKPKYLIPKEKPN